MLDVVVLEEVMIARTKLAASLHMRGCLFDRVTIQGHIGSFDASLFGWTNEWGSTPARRAAVAAFYAKVDFALDLTRVASGNFDLGDIPIELVRPNPELHFRLDRDRADYDAIMNVEGVEYTMYPNDVRALAESDRPSALLMANPKAKNFALDLAALRSLRQRGFVT